MYTSKEILKIVTAMILYFLVSIAITVNAPMNGILPALGNKNTIITIGLITSSLVALVLPFFYCPSIYVSIGLILVYLIFTFVLVQTSFVSK